MKQLIVKLVHIEEYARCVSGTISCTYNGNLVKLELYAYDNGCISLGKKLCEFELSSDISNILSSFTRGLLYMAKRHPDSKLGIDIDLTITLTKISNTDQYALSFKDEII